MAAYASLLSLMNIIDTLKLHPCPPISLPFKQVQSLIEKVCFLLEFLEAYNPHLGYTTEADPLESRIADAAHAAEDVIESHIVDQITSDGGKISSDALHQALEKVIKEMALIQKEAMEVKQTQNQPRIKSTPSDSMELASISQKKKSRMVGADDLKLQMMDKLTSDCRDLQIIPIVGMGGSGKTTLARNIYQERLIKEHFYVCGWATISQEYSIREILIQVLGELINEYSKHSREDKLGEMLHKHLFGRKYLIVMDDMWSIEAWDRVMRYFPDNKNGSRIVITTRLANLAVELASSNSLKMRFLDEADSWDLLSKIVFGEESCPLELEEIGKKIGKSCKGLPLSIVVVGGLLAKSKHAREFWEYIGENLNATVNLEDDERCLKILYMSYRQLPVHLKPCFLYMGVFPEDKPIHISKLIKLWVAEGFLKPIAGISLEDIGKEYLNGLISRNLILIHELGSTGSIKYCKIHDLLRDFCLREAQKERFYGVVRQDTSQETMNAQRRLVVSNNTSEEKVSDALQSMSLARSLIWDFGEAPPSLNFRLLRILVTCSSRSTKAYSLEEYMLRLVNSRYLDISAQWGRARGFPSSVNLLWNLQTLIVDTLQGLIAPAEIWHMPQIRHVHWRGLSLPDPSGQGDIVLRDLQTLVTIKDFKCSKEVVKRIPNIKKLRVSYERLRESCLSNLVCLDKLESFGCFCFPKTNADYLACLNFPNSLKKLSLQSGFWRCWDAILQKIGRLPLLEKLKLYYGSFGGSSWETSEGQFRSLKFLELHECDELEFWKTESSHFPRLEHLVLHRLFLLQEIPLDFAESSTLRYIDLKFCSDSAVVSAKRILEEQEELQGEVTLQVGIMLSRKNEALESLASPDFRVLIAGSN
ncbi:putative late blight resistance protein homolog R1A-10 [Salvia miltiorrhiza]|uniref:putative late blight resistance protein homolog R1A-10 n=1 Tax=Salvia miltiorrhiza TaxID=226208 RepID=UPI0025AB66B8|nr:putative late blight resistance protein homolog R1A-10 [Salvia miltiorrhiza]